MLLYEKVFPGHIALLAARVVVISPPGVLSQLAYGAFWCRELLIPEEFLLMWNYLIFINVV